MELSIGQFCIRLTVWRYDFKRVLRPLEIALFQLPKSEDGAQVQEEMVIAVNEFQDFSRILAVLLGACQRGSDIAQKERSTGAVAVVALVAHM